MSNKTDRWTKWNGNQASSDYEGFKQWIFVLRNIAHIDVTVGSKNNL